MADATVCLLLVAAVFAVYGQTMHFSFINLDDEIYVYENTHVLGGLTAADVAWAFTHANAGEYWHPLTIISFLIDAEMVKTGPGAADLVRLAGRMHLVNVILHAANTILLFLLLRRGDRNLLAECAGRRTLRSTSNPRRIGGMDY